MKSAHYLVECADYNGHKHQLFMMQAIDFRFGTTNYKTLAVGRYDRKTRVLSTELGDYRIYGDWSAKRIAAP